ncbi:MAG: hypothetical protein ACE5GM_11655, partial [bacterium]
KKIQEERSLREFNEIQELLEQAKIDVCSFFVAGKTAADFQSVINSALLPIDYAIQEIPEDVDQATIDPILVEIGKQPKAEQTRLIKKIQPKTGANLTELRAAVKDAVSADNHRQYEELRSQTQRKLGSPILQRGNRAFYLVDNGILEQSVKETPNGPYIESKEIANFHIKIDHEEISDDGEFHDDGSTTLQKILSGKIIGKDWENPFTIRADEWGSNNKLACRISNLAGTRALFSNRDMDVIRMFCGSYSGYPEQETVYSIFGLHPTAGFVSPSVTIHQGDMTATADTGTSVSVGKDYGKAARLDLVLSSKEEVQKIIQHLLSVYLDLQPRSITMPILAHAFLGPLLFGMDLVGEFPPFVLFVAGPSGKGKTETAKFAQSIWGNFQIKEHLASWGSTPEANRQEGARCRGALWVIDDFKRAKIGKSQWGNAIRVLMDYADLQARKRATPGAKLITNYPMKCMLLITGEDVSIAETALQARSLVVDFNGRKDMESFRECMKHQKDYRKIPPHYIAWLQKQKSDKWLTITRQYLDDFLVYVDDIGLDTDNSRRLASNTALSMVGLKAFLDFSVDIKAIDQNYADSLLKIYDG